MTAPDVRTPPARGANAEDTRANDTIVAPEDAERKEQARLAALLALAGGFSLHELACGGFLIARWDRTAHCSDLGQVAAFLRRIGGGA